MLKQNKGFTLLELILVLSVLTITTLIAMTRWQFEGKENSNMTVLSTQIKAMANQEALSVNKDLYFNGNGNINHAQTLSFKYKTCTFQLGFGRFYCE